MTNLLPTIEKESIRKEYRLRIVATILIGVLVSSVIAIVLLIPSYVLTFYKSRAAENVISKVPIQTDDDITSAQRLTLARNAVAIVKADSTVLLPTETFSLIIKHQTPAIKITSLSYSNKNTDPETIRVIGQAQTRQALVAFTNALRAEERVASLDLPVSSFAKDTDILFDFTIITK